MGKQNKLNMLFIHWPTVSSHLSENNVIISSSKVSHLVLCDIGVRLQVPPQWCLNVVRCLERTNICEKKGNPLPFWSVRYTEAYDVSRSAACVTIHYKGYKINCVLSETINVTFCSLWYSERFVFTDSIIWSFGINATRMLALFIPSNKLQVLS